jgi:hypothetical protein
VRTGRTRPDPRFYSLSARVEAVLVQAVIALGLVLIASQLLLTTPTARYVMSYVDRLEGVALWEAAPSVTIALVSGTPGRQAYVLVNGERAANFATGQARLLVGPGDLLELDGTGLDGEGVFEVVETTGAVTSPSLGLRVTTCRGVSSLGRVETTSGPGGN